MVKKERQIEDSNRFDHLMVHRDKYKLAKLSIKMEYEHSKTQLEEIESKMKS